MTNGMNELEKRAGGVFWRALASSFTCCAPLGLFAVFQGLGIKRQAERDNQPVPKRALIAIALGVLSCIELGGFYWYGQQLQHKREQTVEVAEKHMAGKREAQTLDAGTACDLATEYLLKIGSHYDGVKCPGAMIPAGNNLLLTGVIANQGESETKLDACIVHGTRWFVLHAEPGLKCPERLSDPVAATDVDEAHARDAFKQAGEAAAVADFTQRLTTIRAAVAADRHAAKACPESITALPKEERHEISYIDFDLLNAGANRSDHAWDFMTKSNVRKALDPTTDDRGKLGAEILNSSALAVFYSDKRRWPEQTKKEGILDDTYGFIAGGFEGWMLIVDPSTTKVICESPLEFVNGPRVSIDKHGFSKEESRLEDALKEDLQNHFADAATSAIQKLTASHLRLGLKLLE
jgi:hypothetical protein